MASPRLELEEIPPPPDSPRPEPAFAEAQKWIEQVTGRSFGDKDFRSGLENGVLLCELLNAIKPGLVKKINRLSTPIAGLDNTILFLRGCKELGLKESQLFDPGDLQDTSSRVTVKNIDYSRKLKNVLVTIYWLGRAANRCTSYSGATLNLKEFEGLLAQMRKETEEFESPKRNIRDSGYIDCWDSERSDSLSPPRHGRDDSFDSLDSFGSRSQQTPSPDVVLRGSSDGRGSDSESDLPHRKMPDVKKDDMSARRASYGEPKSVVPFNQYLPNKSNQTAYIPAPLRKKKAEREEYRKSWSTATSPLGGEKPFSKNHPETIEEEQNEATRQHEEELVGCMASRTNPGKSQVDLNQNKGETIGQFPSDSGKETAVHKSKERDAEEIRKLRRLEQAGIKVMPAAQRYGSQKQICEDSEPTPDIILHKENPCMMHYQGKDSGSEDEVVCRVPDLEKDDFATRRARLNQPKFTVPFNQFLVGSYMNKDKGKLEGVKKPSQKEKQEYARGNQVHVTSARQIVTYKENPFLQSQDNESEEEEQVKVPDIQRDDLANRKTQSKLTQQRKSPMFVKASITQADLDTWDRLKVSEELSEEDLRHPRDPEPSAEIAVETAVRDDFAGRKARAYKKASGPKQKFVHFGPVTEIDQQKWEKLSIARASPNNETKEETGWKNAKTQTCHETFASATACSLPTTGHNNEVSRPQTDSSEVAWSGTDEYCRGIQLAACVVSQKQTPCRLSEWYESSEEEPDGSSPNSERNDMMARRMGTFQRQTGPVCMPSSPKSVAHHLLQQQKEVIPKQDLKMPQKAESLLSNGTQNCLSSSLPLNCTMEQYHGTLSPVSVDCHVTREESHEKLKDHDQSRGGTKNKVRFPDPAKDDMMARRTGAFLKQPGPSINQFLPVPFSKQQNSQERTKELVKPEKKVKSTTSAGLFKPEKCPRDYANNPLRLAVQPQHREEKEQERQRLPDTGQEVAFTTHMSNCSLDQVHPDQTSQRQEVSERNKTVVSSRDEQLQTFGPRTAVSDDAESVSMFDMRCEDEALMQPHSKARHEKLQNIHNQLKEDEDRWQDDLARWKSRRRSASQDLIKKEAERKKMERLLSGSDGTSERRKSIKTYREIVEEKERREKELHEAYKNARSREEAESILQQYIERFTISEAVLERLEMPKILERSHSAEPNSSSPPKDPDPMRYLRQQSLPPPKYTAMIEATIVPTNELEASISTGQTSPNKTVVSKAVPMLTPKPYSQPKNTQQVLKTFKVDGKVSMNGETFNGVEEKDKECTTVIFAPSLSRSPKFEGVARVDGSPVELKQDTTSIELSLKRPTTHTVHRELTASLTEEVKPANQKDETDSGRTEMMISEFASPASEQKQFKTTVTCARPAVSSMEFPPSTHSEEVDSKDKDLKKPETEQQKEAEVLVTQKVVKSKASEQEGSILFPFLKKVPEISQVTLQNSDQQESPSCASVPLKVRNSWRRSQFFSQSVDSENSDKLNRFSFWSWDPEEERKRQEKWQLEQERLLQARYQKEQDKLKEEWEKAQKEVEEEERRYYEEERKIIEDTVVPFTVSSSFAEPLSNSSSITEGSGTMNMMELSNSQEEDKQKEVKTQETLLWEQEGASLSKSKKSEPGHEKKSSINKAHTEHPETILQRESEVDRQVSVTEHNSPATLNLPLTQDVSWNQQLTKQSPHVSEEVKQKTPLDQSSGQQANSTGERRRTGCHENFRPGPSSPCSPTPHSQSPNRSVSGKKLCSTCGFPLGKGAAMIIETLGLYFHIHCFRCGICKGQLGDAASGTDVRIRNGLLNCNDCYIRSRTAGQPTTL
ncbi:LIM and calponin homology domains-containing protein 1 isoform X3 [Emydura macquarii macquarii]|uniref:LIM and calponin homology domains-containing protein 1 isoform X3 n=1 Tax=Emydura macquarii macquarii TaxID=1129001 RepID=UPI00352B29F7